MDMGRRWFAYGSAVRRVCSVKDRQHVQLMLACSAGGHLLQMLALRPAWNDRSRIWVTTNKADARSLLQDEAVTYAYGPPNRGLRTVARNLALAYRVVRRHRPVVVVTTGAGTAVPFALVGRLHGARVVYIESVTRVSEPSLSCKLIARFADRVYVQSPDLIGAVARTRYVGSLL